MCIQKLVPLERRYIEILHLELNVCNSWVTHAARILGFLLDRAGHPRDLEGTPPGEWEQLPGAQQIGFDLLAHLVKVHGSKMRKPRTQFSGTQCATLYKGGGKALWEHKDLQPGLCALQSSPAYGHLVDSLLQVFVNVDTILQQVNLPLANNSIVIDAVERFRLHAARLCRPELPRVFFCRWGLYDHCIVHHLVPQMRELANIGLSLAQVSSRSLEACNRPAKRTFASLPGGGQVREGDAHDPAVQTFKRQHARNATGRWQEYGRLAT